MVKSEVGGQMSTTARLLETQTQGRPVSSWDTASSASIVDSQSGFQYLSCELGRVAQLVRALP